MQGVAGTLLGTFGERRGEPDVRAVGGYELDTLGVDLLAALPDHTPQVMFQEMSG